MSVLERGAIGALAGAAVGDALGGPTEGRSPEQIKARYGGEVTGIVVQESVPDSVLDTADEIELIDSRPAPPGRDGATSLPEPQLTALRQMALRLTADHRFLMGVNTVDHTIAVFRVARGGELELTDVQDSGGLFPNTIGEHDYLVYVGNVGNPPMGVPGNITGFRLLPNGHLVPIPGSTRGLSNPAISLPAHALFNKDGHQLVVSDLFAEELDVFPVLPSGRLGNPTITPSAGPHPLGMIFGKHDLLMVSESGEVEGSSVSSYALRGSRLNVVSPAVPNGQAGGCWLSVTPDGRLS